MNNIENVNLNGIWEIPDNLDVSNFDFDWKPDLYDPPYIHQFGTQWQKTGGPRYVVPGATQVKYVDVQKAIALPSNSRKWRGSENIEFDFSWHHDETEPPFIYQFGTQWQKTGGPRYVVPGATRVKYMDYPKAKKLPDLSNNCWHNINNMEFDCTWHPDETEPPFIYQFGDQWHHDTGPRYVVPGATQVKYMDYPKAKKLPSMDNWENIQNVEFDFSWHPSVHEPPFIYQFGDQWHHDTGPRYVVPGATQVKYMDYPKAKKLPSMDNWEILYDDIKLDEFDFSWYPSFSENQYTYIFGSEYYTPEEMPCITYGYGPEKYVLHQKVKFNPIDIVFMSNGEDGEEERYDTLCQYANRSVKWVRGINGRETAIKKCTEISDTEWVLVFPAKLKVYPTFDFNWQPNRNGKKRHFIFYADNPVNGLCYGHMAPVAYNREVVLKTVNYGLDFTMSGAHDIVPISAGVAEYNSNPLMTWRTAFREVIKLKVSSSNNDSESEDRLNIWLNVANGKNSEYSILGAKHAIEFYNEVRGDLEKLQNSFSWEWMNNKYNEKFN